MDTHSKEFRTLATRMLAWGAGLTLITLSACTSKPNSPLTSRTPTSQNAPIAAASANSFDGGSYCVQTFLEGPSPALALHFSNQVVASDPTAKSKDFQADYAQDAVDLVHRDRWLATEQDKQFFEESKKFTDPKIILRTIDNGFAEETVTTHAARSDQINWRGVITGIAQGGTPWNLFVAKPKVNPVGPDNVNGFETIKYTVDTTQQGLTDKAALTAFGKLQNYEIVGTAWVLKDGNCVLQYNIDYQETGKDGKVRKTHYEGTVKKK